MGALHRRLRIVMSKSVEPLRGPETAETAEAVGRPRKRRRAIASSSDEEHEEAKTPAECPHPPTVHLTRRQCPVTRSRGGSGSPCHLSGVQWQPNGGTTDPMSSHMRVEANPFAGLADSDAESDGGIASQTAAALHSASDGRASPERAQFAPRGTLAGLADSDAESSGDNLAARQAYAPVGHCRRRAAVALGADTDPEVEEWERDLCGRQSGTSQCSAFSLRACRAIEIRQLPASSFVSGQPVFDSAGKVNLQLLLGAYRSLIMQPRAVRDPGARHIGWLARQACSAGLVSDRELRLGRVSRGCAQPSRGCRGGPGTAEIETPTILAADRELSFPSQPQRLVRENVGNTCSGGKLFSDSEDDVKRFMRRKQAVTDLKSHSNHRQAQIRSLSSNRVDLRGVRDTLSAPGLSFDWNGRGDDSDAGSDGLEVDVPSNHLHRDSRRDLLKDQIHHSMSRLLVEGLIPEEARSKAQGLEPEEAKSRAQELLPEQVGVPPKGLVPEEAMDEVGRCSPASGDEQEQALCSARRPRSRRVVPTDDPIQLGSPSVQACHPPPDALVVEVPTAAASDAGSACQPMPPGAPPSDGAAGGPPPVLARAEPEGIEQPEHCLATLQEPLPMRQVQPMPPSTELREQEPAAPVQKDPLKIRQVQPLDCIEPLERQLGTLQEDRPPKKVQARLPDIFQRLAPAAAAVPAQPTPVLSGSSATSAASTPTAAAVAVRLEAAQRGEGTAGSASTPTAPAATAQLGITSSSTGDAPPEDAVGAVGTFADSGGPTEDARAPTRRLKRLHSAALPPPVCGVDGPVEDVEDGRGTNELDKDGGACSDGEIELTSEDKEEDAAASSDCSWMAEEAPSSGNPLHARQRRLAVLRQRRTVKQCARRIREELRCSSEAVGSTEAQALKLGVAAMSREDRLRWQRILPQGAGGAPTARSPVVRAAVPVKRLLGSRRDDQGSHLYSLAGVGAREVSFLRTGAAGAKSQRKGA